MKIIKIQHSPFPQLMSITSTRLQLNQSERSCLRKASHILEQVTKKTCDYLKKEWGYPDHFDLSDIDFDLSYIMSNHTIDELLETHDSEGIRLGD